MVKQTSKGNCSSCNATVDKAKMTTHLKSCNKAKVASEKQSPQETKIFHIIVEGRYQPEYWMHLSVPAHAMLKELDSFLRRIWLECCGHLSAFTIQGIMYSTSPMEEYDEKGMKVTLGNVLGKGMRSHHEYDFGTTTELTLRVVSEEEGEAKGKSIQLLAMNDAPLIKCEVCEEAATQVCTQCVYSGEGWLCDKCAGEHECGEEMYLPVVNSPRVGMCGYAG